MTDDLIHHIPQPDKSGAIENQTAESQNLVIIRPESPMSMGQAVSGLAAESHSGFNKQTSLVIAASWAEERKARADAEDQLKFLLPENALLKERVNNLMAGKKKAALINLMGIIILPIGAGMASGPDTTNHSTGWLLVAIGAVLCLVDIFNSFRGKN